MDFPWETIQKLTGPRELERFYAWMQEQIGAGDAVEVAPPDTSIAVRLVRFGL